MLDTFRIPLMDKEVIKFFSQTFRDTVEHRRRNKIVRKDFISLLMQLMDKGVLLEEEGSSQTNAHGDY